MKIKKRNKKQMSLLQRKSIHASVAATNTRCDDENTNMAFAHVSNGTASEAIRSAEA